MCTDWAVVFATIAGPIFAVWASEWRQDRKRLHDRKEFVFRSLMTTRSTPLHRDHVSAINHIDIAFPKDQHPELIDAWYLYRQHLDTPQDQSNKAVWDEKARTLLADLIHLMAKDLKIPFDKSQITQSSYVPNGHVKTELEHAVIREQLIMLLSGQQPLWTSSEKPHQDAPHS